MKTAHVRHTTPWWRTVAAVIAFESRIALRTWRFWLIFGLLASVAYLVHRDFKLIVEQDIFLDPARAFSHPGIGMAILVSIFGSILLGVDISARLDRTRVSSILYTRPMGTFAFLLGRYLTVLIILIPLTALGWFVLPCILWTLGHSDSIWQPFVVVYAAMLLPTLFLGAAAGLLFRILTGKDFVAICCVLAVFGSLAWLTYSLGSRIEILDTVTNSMLPAIRAAEETLKVEVVRQGSSRRGRHSMHHRHRGGSSQQSYNVQNIDPFKDLAPTTELPSPTLGLAVNQKDLLKYNLSTALIALAFLTAAPLYIRRQEPQQSVVLRNARWYTLPTFRRALGKLRFDHQLPWIPKLFGILSLAGMIAGTAMMVQLSKAETHAIRDYEEGVDELKVSLQRRDPVDTSAYDISLEIDIPNRAIAVKGTMRLTPEAENLSEIHLTLPHNFVVSRLDIQGLASSYENGINPVRIIKFDSPLAKGTEIEVAFEYAGPLDGEIYETTGQLAKDLEWYPTPYDPSLDLALDDSTSQSGHMRDIFDATIRVKGLSYPIIFAGQTLHDAPNDEWAEMKTNYPIDNLAVFWGPYIAIEDQFGPTPVTFLALEQHAYQAEVYLRDVKGLQNKIVSLLGPLRVPRLTFMERCGWLDRYPDPQLSGLISISERKLVYLHEGIWDLERFDINPLEVPYYRALRPVVWELQKQYLDRYVESYLQGTYEATGPLAFWIEKYLPSYVAKLMEPNIWRRRSLLTFDAGTSVSGAAIRHPLAQLRATDQDDSRAVAAERLRAEGLWRTLHHMLGERAWWKFLRTLLSRYNADVVDDKAIQSVAEEVAGRSLDGFFKEWVYGSALPQYEITKAEAELVQDPNSFLASYRCTVHVKNLGTGSIDVPIFIKTEIDEVQRLVWIDSGGEGTLNIEVPHRPVFAMIDPSNWLLQEVYRVEGSRLRQHHEARFEIKLNKDGALMLTADDV